jgi:16S rRNA A1518/A1519 N6-dimethyltransferase RsmA/KsgA/DIM1 with predicted DNA glycosylase/AP lyase activity
VNQRVEQLGKKQCVRAGVANKPYIISVELLQYNFVKKDLATNSAHTIFQALFSKNVLIETKHPLQHFYALGGLGVNTHAS